jgi:hypothetical protein
LRYIDVVLVVAALPLVVLADLPLLGYAIGTVAWIAARGSGVLLERWARRSTDPRRVVGLGFAGALGRAWLVGGAIIAVGLAGEREDGLMAAVLVAVAFTVYFGMTLVFHVAGSSR